MPRPDAFVEILGSSFVKKQAQTVLTIGEQHYDKYSLVHRLDCAGSYRAARILTAALKSLGVLSVKDAVALDVSRLAKLRGVGCTTLYIMLAWQENFSGRGHAKKWYGERPSFLSVQRRARKGRRGQP
jgi:hypothetical protein